MLGLYRKRQSKGNMTVDEQQYHYVQVKVKTQLLTISLSITQLILKLVCK